MPKSTLLRKKSVKTGAIISYGGNTIPKGYLLCDGSIVNRADYPKLFSSIGTAHGHGNNDGLTFHLPDLRGRFIRGFDETAGNDLDSGGRIEQNPGGNVGNNVGSLQDYAVRDINGFYQVSGSNRFANGIFFRNASGRRPSGDSGATVNARFDADRVVPTSNELRPENISIKMIIKVI